jgi:hypothetical protein
LQNGWVGFGGGLAAQRDKSDRRAIRGIVRIMGVRFNGFRRENGVKTFASG